MALGLFRCPDRSQGQLVNFCPILTVKLKTFKIKANPKSHIYIIDGLYYMYITLWILYILRIVWIFVFILVWGGLGSLLFKDWAERIIPLGYFLLLHLSIYHRYQGLYLFYWCWLLYDFFYWFHGYSLFWGLSSFSTQILSIETEWNFPSILRIMAIV